MSKDDWTNSKLGLLVYGIDVFIYFIVYYFRLLANRTNGRAYDTMRRPSGCNVCTVAVNGTSYGVGDGTVG